MRQRVCKKRGAGIAWGEGGSDTLEIKREEGGGAPEFGVRGYWEVALEFLSILLPQRCALRLGVCVCASLGRV